MAHPKPTSPQAMKTTSLALRSLKSTPQSNSKPLQERINAQEMSK